MQLHKTFGLVIQGPLGSMGRGGGKAHVATGSLAVGEIATFDCRENIRQTVQNFGPLFKHVIVSTWDSDVKPDDHWDGVVLVSQPDPGGIERGGNMYSYKANNKYRQFLSTHRGIVELEKMGGTDYVIKMRSDQYIDLQELTQIFVESIKNENDPQKKIFAPYFYPSTFLLHDFYFAAELGVLKDFCESVLAYDQFEFIDSVHREMILKHAYQCYKQEINVPDWAYFPRSPANGSCKNSKRIFQWMFDHVYRSLGETVIRSVIWRGSAFSNEYISDRFLENYPSPSRYHVPAWASIDWDRYFTFRAMIKNKKTSWVEQVFSLTGLGLWKSWQMFRKFIIRSRNLIRGFTMKKTSEDY